MFNMFFLKFMKCIYNIGSLLSSEMILEMLVVLVTMLSYGSSDGDKFLKYIHVLICLELVVLFKMNTNNPSPMSVIVESYATVTLKRSLSCFRVFKNHWLTVSLGGICIVTHTGHIFTMLFSYNNVHNYSILYNIVIIVMVTFSALYLSRLEFWMPMEI